MPQSLPEPRLFSPELPREVIKTTAQWLKSGFYTNIVLQGQEITELAYQPLKCAKSYRLMVGHQNLSIPPGEKVLFDEIRYFFYITNRADLTVE